MNREGTKAVIGAAASHSDVEDVIEMNIFTVYGTGIFAESGASPLTVRSSVRFLISLHS